MAGRRTGVLVWLGPLLVLALVAALWWVARSSPTAPSSAGTRASASAGTHTPDSGLPTVPESALPTQARHTLDLIRSGGPYPYRQDDRTWDNRERLLPTRTRGYYREYTVNKPGSPDRGPWRIIAGRDGDLYWTADHYASFRQIEEGR